MSRTLGLVLLLLGLSSLIYARSNVCLANTANGTPYKPVQLFNTDCPNNVTNCTAFIYNYSAKDFMSKGPASLLPVAKNRESIAYLTQDENDNIEAVVVTATSYTNNFINVKVNVTGAEPGAQTILRDDPNPDTWNWDPTTNSGSFTWQLDAYYTDGVVLGPFKLVKDYCFRVSFLPNYNGAVATVSFLTGTVAKTTRVFTSKMTNGQFYEFCQYPMATVSGTDASCSSLGSATATSLTSGTATYKWMNTSGATIGTSSTINGLAAGNYTVDVTVNGCTANRPVTIGMTGVPLSATSTVTQPTKTKAAKIALTISGGSPPYTITWTNSAGTVIQNGGTSLSVTASGTYTATIADGCSTKSYDFSISTPGACPPGTFVDIDSCSGCPAGTYSNASDSAACKVCPPGTQNTVANATSCNQCGENSMSGGATGPCTACPTSTYSERGSGLCTPCPVGTERVSGSTSCTPCAAGSYRCDGNSACQSCPAGTFSAGGQQACSPCDAGTMASSDGTTSCTTCPASRYAASGATSCTACPSGTAAPAGSSVLLACM